MKEEIGPRDRLERESARSLMERARRAREGAYAPYSGFRVGAAVYGEDGRIVDGANVENAAYGSSMCAERVAILSAVSQGIRSFVAIAIAGPQEVGACLPCGACLQVLQEFGPMIVVLEGTDSEPRQVELAALFPEPFAPGHLPLP